MIPILYINCSSAPYVDDIMRHLKLYETRSRDTLRSLVGRRVLIAQTGKGPSVVMCSARIRSGFELTTEAAWNMFRKYTRVPEGDRYDWTPSTRSRWLYELVDVCPVPVPFHPADGVRHGRVWMEYAGKFPVSGMKYDWRQ